MPVFAPDCLTVPVAGTYIAFTEGGSSLGVAGLVDFSAKGWRDRACVIGLGFCRRLCALSALVGSLTLLMEEREAQAAGPCGSGGLASQDA
jgi:hypothetical protein